MTLTQHPEVSTLVPHSLLTVPVLQECQPVTPDPPEDSARQWQLTGGSGGHGERLGPVRWDLSARQYPIES